MNLSQIDTPALIVDLNAMDCNLKRMQNFINKSPHSLRPHTKAHKIPEIAKMQIEHGAKGICVAKLGEAEVMADGGIDDILITTPIANPIKVNRLVTLKTKYPDFQIIQVVDNKKQVQAISQKAQTERVVIDLLIEVECGQKRCGVNVGKELIDLIQFINEQHAVTYRGIQAYTGHLQHVNGYQERCKQARALVKPVFDFIDSELQSKELNPEIVSGGGTGTYDAYEGLPFTEIQAGSYLFMDWDYHTIGSKNGEKNYNDFNCALKVWTTVISRPTKDRAVVDAGMKCLSIDSGMPVAENYPQIQYTSGGDEHGILNFSPDFNELQIGDRLMMIPSHCDTTLNQFDILYGIRGDIAEKQWKILGRGRSD